MAQTYDQRPAFRTDDEVVRELQAERKRKPVIAVGALVAGLASLLAVIYFSYRDVPAPENPANARPHLVEPYR